MRRCPAETRTRRVKEKERKRKGRIETRKKGQKIGQSWSLSSRFRSSNTNCTFVTYTASPEPMHSPRRRPPIEPFGIIFTSQ